HREILPGAECAAYARHREPNLLQRQPEDTRQLLLVDVQPLGRDAEVDAALAVRNREPRLGAQRRLVLHADLVLALDHHVGARGPAAAGSIGRIGGYGCGLRAVARQSMPSACKSAE